MSTTEIGDIGEQIERLVESAKKTEILIAGPEPTGHYYLVGPDGVATPTLAKPSWHSEQLDSPAELAKFYRDSKIAKPTPAVFYDEGSVVLVPDLTDRRDRATCKLVTSTQFDTLKGCVGKTLAQKDFIRLLRVTFRGCMNDSGLLPLLRNIQWNTGDSGQSNIQHGKESLGRNLIAQVQGVDVIPEELTLTIPVFENHKFRTSVACAIDVFPENRTFALTPYPQELHNAMEATLDDILIQLSAEGMPPAFRGKP